MRNSSNIVRAAINSLLTGIEPAHRISPEKLIRNAEGDRRFRSLHDRHHSGRLSDEALFSAASKKFKPVVFSHRKLKGGTSRKPRRSRNRPLASRIVSVNKDGRLNVPSDLLLLVSGSMGGVRVARGSNAENAVIVSSGKDTRLRLTKTQRKAMGFEGTETSIQVLAFSWGIGLQSR